MSASILLAGDPRGIWKRYVVALVVIAGLLLTSHLAPQWSVNASAKNAELLNISDRQRMLSQRVQVLSTQVIEGYSESSAADLIETVQLFSDSQNKLANNSRVRSQLRKLYGSPVFLNDRVREFSLLALVVADPKADRIQAYRDLRAFDTEALYSDLDLAVSGIEEMAAADVARLKALQKWSLYVAIFVLLLEAGLIFLPAQISVTRFIDKLEEKSDALRRAHEVMRQKNQSLLEMKAQIEKDHRIDQLTGLANRLGINSALEFIAKEDGRGDRSLNVFHIDLDGFRLINDAYGQQAGDLVLKQVATILQECAPNPDLIARIGSDEFLIVLAAPASMDELLVFASAVRQVIEKPIDIGSAKCHISASIGIASSGQEEWSYKELIAYADLALKRAKSLGSGRSVLFEADLLEELRLEKELAQELDAAFAKRQFTVHYQPIFTALDRKIESLEALVRWDRPGHGTQSAGLFMDHIYRLGLSSKLDQFVLSQVLEDIDSAKLAGVPLPKIAINVSAGSLMDSDYLARISACGLPESGLSLEISESVDFERHMEQIHSRISAFRDIGLEIEIDDFGTGHASLYSFKTLRPSRVKIARELVIDVETAQDTQQMVETIATLAKSFGAAVVAEGVENEDMAKALTLLGCDYLQGFGLSRPKSYDQTLQQLKTLSSIASDQSGLAA